MINIRNISDVTNYATRYGTLVALLLIILLFSVFVPRFATVSNFLTLLVQISTLSIVVVGVTTVFVAGELDISTGALVSLAGVLSAVLLSFGWNPIAAIFVALLVGITFGCVNGLFVGYFRVPALLTTFGTAAIALGINFWLGGGSSIMLFDEIAGPLFVFLGQGRLIGIPMPFIIALIVFIAFSILLERTKYGLRMYAVGGNREAAKIFGINSQRLKFFAFVLCGFTAALSGIVLTSRLGTGSPIGGANYTLDAIAAVFIGVSMFREGEPHLLGSVLGVLIFGVLVNGMSLVGIGYEIQSILRGVFVLIAVAIAGGRVKLEIKLF
jgi:ribose/xylose/arabinose/galactoside ABC-type transport system permease subunit